MTQLSFSEVNDPGTILDQLFADGSGASKLPDALEDCKKRQETRVALGLALVFLDKLLLLETTVPVAQYTFTEGIS